MALSINTVKCDKILFSKWSTESLHLFHHWINRFSKNNTWLEFLRQIVSVKSQNSFRNL